MYNLALTGDEVQERGLQATAPIEDDAVIIAAPLSCALTSTDAIKRFGSLWKRFAKKTPVHTLALELMHDAISNPDCVWIKSLPAHVGNWPQWTPAEKAAFSRNARVRQLLAQQEEEYAAAEKSLLAPVQASDDFGPEYSAEKFRYTCLSIRLCIILLSVGGY